MIGLKGALEQQNMRYGKTSHISASKQAGRFGGGGWMVVAAVVVVGGE